MANVPSQNFQKLWLNHVASLSCGRKDAIQQHPDAAGVMERIHIELSDRHFPTSGCTPVSVGKTHEGTEVILNAAEICRNLHQLLKGKKYNALDGL
jgi:hypothetical protein